MLYARFKAAERLLQRNCDIRVQIEASSLKNGVLLDFQTQNQIARLAINLKKHAQTVYEQNSFVYEENLRVARLRRRKLARDRYRRQLQLHTENKLYVEIGKYKH